MTATRPAAASTAGAADGQQMLLILTSCIIIFVMVTAIYAIYCMIRVCVAASSSSSSRSQTLPYSSINSSATSVLNNPRYTVLPAVLLACSLSTFFVVLPQLVDSSLNRVVVTTRSGAKVLPTPSTAAVDLHQTLWIADAHADTLLWPNRNLMQRLSWGHVDLPRLFEGNVALQVFSMVTSSPRGLNFDGNAPPTIASDTITLKVIAERWGIDAINSRFARCLFQIRRLQEIAHDTNGTLTVITSSGVLRDYIAHREAHRIAEESLRNLRDRLVSDVRSGGVTALDAINTLNREHAAHGLHSSFGGRVVAALLAVEGLHALDDRDDNIDRLYDAGVRMMSLTHFYDNSLGGSSAGIDKIGITEMGTRIVKRMNELNIIIDVAHASDALIDDIIRVSTKPLIVSHTGVRHICNNSRNIDDDHIRAIARHGSGHGGSDGAASGSDGDGGHAGVGSGAAGGGLICIGYFRPAICGDDDLASIVASIDHIVRLVGERHVCLGSDYDGTVVTSFDTAHLVYVTDALLKYGYTHQQIAMIMGGNLRDFLLQHLPTSDGRTH